ncbi:hypothetical protein AB0940_24995 [Streptomyces sp. NPDC006656]|uniref:hypothetical protein n=1 Tax=Streptomyces sp. NPDC006656 TaxID=3156899 RepID=UPI00345610BB
MVNSSTGLRLTTDGFVHRVKGADRELPWSKIMALAPGKDKLICITHAKGAWDRLHAACGPDTVALQDAQRLWACTHRGQRT